MAKCLATLHSDDLSITLMSRRTEVYCFERQLSVWAAVKQVFPIITGTCSFTKAVSIHASSSKKN